MFVKPLPQLTIKLLTKKYKTSMHNFVDSHRNTWENIRLLDFSHAPSLSILHTKTTIRRPRTSIFDTVPIEHSIQWYQMTWITRKNGRFWCEIGFKRLIVVECNGIVKFSLYIVFYLHSVCINSIQYIPSTKTFWLNLVPQWTSMIG